MGQDITTPRGVLETGVQPRRGEPPMPPEEVLRAVYQRSRGKGAVIAIGSRRAPRGSSKEPWPHYLTVLDVENWQPLFPALIEYGDLRQETLYWSPNPLRPAAIKGVRTPEEMTKHVLAGGVPEYVEVKNKHVMELGALVLDLDVGREGSNLAASDALGAAVARSLDGRLLPPSLFAYSGTGAYLFYLLTGKDGYLPLATPETIAVYKASQQVLLRLTADLESDKNATRLCNWYKLPGATDTKTGSPVVYLPFLTSGDRDLRRYDLSDLAAALGVEPPEERLRGLPPGPVAPLSPPRPIGPRPTPISSPGATPPAGRVRRVKRGKGGEMYRERYRELEKLWNRRGGIAQGIRHEFLRQVWLNSYKDAMTNAPQELPPAARRRLAWGETMPRLRWVNATHCKPPLPEPELVKVTTPGKYSAQSIIDALGITAEERRELSYLITEGERRQRQKAQQETAARRRQDRERRQAAIDADLLAGLGVRATAAKHEVDPSTTSRRLAKLRRERQASAPTLFGEVES